MTVGERNPGKINKTILLVGETGSGKTTLINTLVSYVMGVTWEDDIWFKITGEENGNGNNEELESDTNDVIVYEVFGFEDKIVPYSLTLIDTPGYGDTRGREHDDQIGLKLYQLFQSGDGIHEINAVGLVLQENVPRLSDRMLYILNSMMSLFGKDMEGNIVTLITYSRGRTPTKVIKALEKVKIKCAKNKEKEPFYFQFDNCLDEDRKKDTESLKDSENITQKGLAGLTTFLENMPPQNVKKTVDVMKNRIRLAACIQNLEERIKTIESKQAAIKLNKEALKTYEEKKRMNENYIEEYNEVYQGEEPFSEGGMWGLFFFKGVTRCTICKENCHRYGCTMAWEPAHCEVMEKGLCVSCTKKCPVSAHRKDDKYYVTKTRKVQITKEDMKKEYDRHAEMAENQSSLLETLENELKELTRQQSQLLEKAYKLVLELEAIALSDSSGSTLVHLDFLIKKMEEKGDTEKVRKLQEINSREDPNHRNALLWYFAKPVNIVRNLIENTGHSQPALGTNV